MEDCRSWLASKGRDAQGTAARGSGRRSRGPAGPRGALGDARSALWRGAGHAVQGGGLRASRAQRAQLGRSGVRQRPADCRGAGSPCAAAGAGNGGRHQAAAAFGGDGTRSQKYSL